MHLVFPLTLQDFFLRQNLVLPEKIQYFQGKIWLNILEASLDLILPQ